MKILIRLLFLVGITANVFAADGRSYQVTGTVIEVTGSKITVEKGAERWEIALDPVTRGSSDLKVGSQVTITYVMMAAQIAAQSSPSDSGAKLKKFGAQKKEGPAMPAGARPPR